MKHRLGLGGLVGSRLVTHLELPPGASEREAHLARHPADVGEGVGRDEGQAGEAGQGAPGDLAQALGAQPPSAGLWGGVEQPRHGAMGPELGEVASEEGPIPLEQRAGAALGDALLKEGGDPLWGRAEAEVVEVGGGEGEEGGVVSGGGGEEAWVDVGPHGVGGGGEELALPGLPRGAEAEREVEEHVAGPLDAAHPPLAQGLPEGPPRAWVAEAAHDGPAPLWRVGRPDEGAVDGAGEEGAGPLFGEEGEGEGVLFRALKQPPL